ncbi:Os06g0107200, partial [Oryza sativa Japonica Group]
EPLSLGHDVTSLFSLCRDFRRCRVVIPNPIYGGDAGLLHVHNNKKTLAIREQVSVSPGREPGVKNRTSVCKRRPRTFISLRLLLRSSGLHIHHIVSDYKDRNEEEYEGMNISLLEEASVQKADAKPVYCTKFLSDWVCSLRNFKWKVVAGIHQALVPNEYSWEEVMGSPIIQYAGGCSLSACSVCIDRLAFERIHGRGSFAWRVESPPAKLRKECLKRNAWSQESGGKSDRVLDVIIDIGGLPTTDGIIMLPWLLCSVKW